STSGTRRPSATSWAAPPTTWAGPTASSTSSAATPRSSPSCGRADPDLLHSRGPPPGDPAHPLGQDGRRLEARLLEPAAQLVLGVGGAVPPRARIADQGGG